MSSASSAARVRLHRERLSKGVRVGKIQYDLAAVSDALIRAKQLSPSLADDDDEVDRAIERLLVIFTKEDAP